LTENAVIGEECLNMMHPMSQTGLIDQ